MIGTHQRPASAQSKAQRSWRMRVVIATSLMCLLAGCAFGTSQAPPGSGEPTTSRRPTPSTRHLEPRQAERIQMVMTPLIQHMNHPLPLNQVRVGILDTPGRAAADCDPLHGDDAALPVHWNGQTDISVPDDKPLILHFRLRQAELFGFEWV